MKKMILSVVVCAIALTTIGTVIVSCEKERTIKQSTTVDSKKPGNEGTEKIMPPNITIANLSGICQGITCATPAPFSISQYNRIRITKDAYTIANYPATMRYTIYTLGAHISGNYYYINRITDFDCPQNAPVYSNTLLNNSTQYYMRISDPSGAALPATDIIDITTPSPTFPFTTANYKGLPC